MSLTGNHASCVLVDVCVCLLCRIMKTCINACVCMVILSNNMVFYLQELCTPIVHSLRRCLQRRGKKNQRDQARRRRERLSRVSLYRIYFNNDCIYSTFSIILQKLKERLSVLEKSHLSEEKRIWETGFDP